MQKRSVTILYKTYNKKKKSSLKNPDSVEVREHRMMEGGVGRERQTDGWRERWLRVGNDFPWSASGFLGL